MEEIYKELAKHIPQERILKSEPMSKHTSFKIGGPADIFVKVNNLEELKYVLELSKTKNVPLTVIGNGSNVLVKDKGIRGITVKLNFDDIIVRDEVIQVEAGVLLSKLARTAYDNSLAGMEFASGIPGTIGGAIKMNAGAYGGEFKDIVLETIYLDENLELQIIKNKEHNFSYRNSLFNQNDKFVIISTKLKLHKDDKEKIKGRMDENSRKRKQKQPINYPNAGSIFKRKNEFIPAEIIDKCGLKGYNIGNAYVSEMHAGFIVNKGNATATEVLQLIDYIKKTVNEKQGINLELEIKILGE